VGINFSQTNREEENIMKQLMLFLSMVVLSSATLASHVDSDNPTISLDARVGTLRLLDPGITSYDDPVLKTLLSAKWKNGFGLHLFHVTGLGECFENSRCKAQEVKPEISYNHLFDNWRLYGKLSYSALGELGETKKDFFQIKTRVQYTDWPIKPYLETNYQHLIGVGGGIGLTQVGADWPIRIAPKWMLKLNADAAYDSAPFRRDNGWLARGHAELWYAVDPKIRLGIWTKGRVPIMEFESDRDGVASGVGLKLEW